MKPRPATPGRGFAIAVKKAILGFHGYPSGLCVGTAQYRIKEGPAMWMKLVFSLLAAVAMILLLASDAR